MQQLPMEFAGEAQKRISISLEGSLRVCPETSVRITKFSEHKPN
jgi:hypothetical protein